MSDPFVAAVYSLRERLDPSDLPKIILSGGEIHRDPVRVDHWHGIGTMFTEDHTHSDILRYLAADMGWDDLIAIAQAMKDACNGAPGEGQ